MVVSFERARRTGAQERAEPLATPREQVSLTAIADGTICPRCDALLTISYDDSTCILCGYVDHDYRPPEIISKRQNMVSSGTRYVLRYVGEFPSLAETLAHIKLQRLRNRVVYSVTCPFCAKAMIQSSLSGKRREVREERYKCTEGHRVSLTPTINGSLGWK